jgi:tetratricopeptide (TPR) repeat protein
MAHAHLREVAEREARLERARRLEESARAHLARGRFDRAIKDARQAAELDPAGTAAPGLIAEAFQRQSEEATREAQAKEAARRAAEMREMLATGNKALRNKEFPRARSLGEQALALDPDSSEARDFIGKVAAAAALAASTLEDETVDLQANQFDPEATAVFAPVSEGVVARWGGALHRWFDRVRANRGAENQRSPAVQSPETVGADVAAGVDPDQKEA